MKILSLIVCLLVTLTACNKEDDKVISPSSEVTPYFPPLTSNEWEATDPEDIGWNTEAIPALLTHLEQNNTRAFIILKDGKIMIEAYFGNAILGGTSFNENSQWYWASAGKTLTAALVGIAQQEGSLDITEPTSTYLGEGWTSLPSEKETLIRVQNQLSMTTGLDYEVPDLDCTLPSCLTFKRDPGQQWYYHNAPYTLLEKVVENATNTNYNTFTDQKIESKIGMNGQWREIGYNNVYWSTARDMARFGLLVLNKGKWEDEIVLSDMGYYNQMISKSQDLNPSYGYLWWLNGEESVIFPGLANSVPRPLSETAPNDLFAGLGKNGQFLEIIPSMNMVVIRMGESPDDSLVPIAYHDEMWEKINLVLD